MHVKTLKHSLATRSRSLPCHSIVQSTLVESTCCFAVHQLWHVRCHQRCHFVQRGSSHTHLLARASQAARARPRAALKRSVCSFIKVHCLCFTLLGSLALPMQERVLKLPRKTCRETQSMRRLGHAVGSDAGGSVPRQMRILESS